MSEADVHFNAPRSAFSEADDGPWVYGYMCATDFEYELGAAAGGNRIFASIEDLQASVPCWAGCGIVEVRVTGVQYVVQSSND